MAWITSWVVSVIESKWVFLLVLNLLLLVVGALMDIFSAIILVVPVIIPLALQYDIGLAHLGIVFLANLELGYMTPPVGLNVFVVKSTLGESVRLGVVFKGVLWFLAADLLVLAMLVAFPQLTLWVL